MLAIFGAFRKQWKAFVDEFDKLGKHLDQARDDYATLMSTRTRLLRNKIDEVDRLLEQEEVALPEESGSGETEVGLLVLHDLKVHGPHADGREFAMCLASRAPASYN